MAAGLRKTRPVGGGASAASRTSGQRASNASRRRAPPGGRGPSRCTRADRRRTPGADGRSGRSQVEPVGVGELGRIAVGAGERHDDEVAGARSLCRPASTSPRRRSGRRRRPPARGAATPRRRRRPAPDRRRPPAARPGRASRYHSALRIIPSVVSIPPNMITAAFDTVSSSLSPPVRRRGGPIVAPSAAIAPRPAVGRPARRAIPDTEATISRYQPSSRSTDGAVAPSRPSLSATTAAASGPASSARSSAAGRPSASTQPRRPPRATNAPNAA